MLKNQELKNVGTRRFQWTPQHGDHKLTLCNKNKGDMEMVSDPETELTVLTVSIGFATMGGKNKELLQKLEEARSMFHNSFYQSTTAQNGAAQNLAAMKWDTTYSHGSCTHTEEHPWLECNLNLLKDNEKDKFFVTNVILMNRGDCCGDRLSPYEISVDGKVCGGKQRTIGQGATSLL